MSTTSAAGEAKPNKFVLRFFFDTEEQQERFTRIAVPVLQLVRGDKQTPLPERFDGDDCKACKGMGIVNIRKEVA